MVFALAEPAFGIPVAGEHSARPKYWPALRRWVTNFTPFALQGGPIVGLSPDGNGGLWFGVGQTVEHIDRSGRMTNYLITQDVNQWLWQVWDIAQDPNGRRWFSIGQSGRIGTIDYAGHVRTRVLVARKFYPDIRALRFSLDGTLWFIDSGRSSIGHRASDGAVTEIPMPNGAMPVGLTLCRGRAFVAAMDTYKHDFLIDAIYAVAPGSLSLTPIVSWPHSDTYMRRGELSVACDKRENVWFAHAGRRVPSIDGYIDRRQRVHQQRSLLSNERVTDIAGGGVMFTGGRVSREQYPDARVAVVVRAENGTRIWTLPMEAEWFDDEAAAGSDGTTWLVSYPYPITRLSVKP